MIAISYIFIYYLSPLFAILLLIINSFGFPIRNYNPETSDTFKTHYYSFLLVISFVFIVLNLESLHDDIKSSALPLVFK